MVKSASLIIKPINYNSQVLFSSLSAGLLSCSGLSAQVNSSLLLSCEYVVTPIQSYILIKNILKSNVNNPTANISNSNALQIQINGFTVPSSSGSTHIQIGYNTMFEQNEITYQ